MTTSRQQQTESFFLKFIHQHVQEVPDFSEIPLEKTGLADQFKNYPLKLTHFEDLYDTLMYSSLIKKSLDLNPGVKTVLDFGAGSSIPTLLAVKESGRTDVNILAIDIDPEARIVGTHNAELLGLSGNYSFNQVSMLEVLNSELVNQPNLMISSNPPYIATPEEMKDREFVPINGGSDGSQYMLDILSKDYPKGTILTLLWGSLTNPNKVIPAMNARYDLLHMDAMRIHFGKYTQNPAIKKHLYKLRQEGQVAFDVFKGKESQIVLGTILKAT